MKVKRLYTIGDSWTYGHDLENPKEQSWPTLLSREFDCELMNNAENGGSNDWVFRKTVEWVSEHKNFDDTIVIVAWSEPNRREENYEFYNGSRLAGDKIEQFIFNELHNDDLAHYKSISYIVTLQEFLKSKNIKYLFFQPWYDLVGWHGYYRVIKQIDKKYCIGPFVEGYKKEYPVDKIVPSHPNKKEHKIMTKFIKEKLVELYG
jgi:hypothetical protein